MANYVLNDAAFKKAANEGNPGWAAPQPGSGYNTPISDGPITKQPGRMTMDGAVTATAVLLAILMVAAGAGWVTTAGRGIGNGTWLLAAIVSIGVGFAMSFKPKLSPILAPIYAIVMGYAVGAISRSYEYIQNGIVVQAVGATLAVFAVMLFLYKTKVIKVTNKFRRIVTSATLGLMLFYMVSFVLRLVGVEVPFLRSGGVIGIGFSFLTAGLAASNLALDFDTTERGVATGAPKYMEWFCAFGITSTLVWLYLELLRLINLLSRD